MICLPSPGSSSSGGWFYSSLLTTTWIENLNKTAASTPLAPRKRLLSALKCFLPLRLESSPPSLSSPHLALQSTTHRQSESSLGNLIWSTVLHSGLKSTTSLFYDDQAPLASEAVSMVRIAESVSKWACCWPFQSTQGMTMTMPSPDIQILPPNFHKVVDGVYRSGYPVQANYSFLKTLGLKMVMWVSMCGVQHKELTALAPSSKTNVQNSRHSWLRMGLLTTSWICLEPRRASVPKSWVP